MIGHSFVRPKRPFLRPDLPIGRAPRADAVQDARLRAPAQPARSVLDRVEHGASLAARDDHTPLRGVLFAGLPPRESACKMVGGPTVSLRSAVDLPLGEAFRVR